MFGFITNPFEIESIVPVVDEAVAVVCTVFFSIQVVAVEKTVADDPLGADHRVEGDLRGVVVGLSWSVHCPIF